MVASRGVGFAVPLVIAAGFLPGGFQVPIYLAAGWMGLPLARFLIADLIGTAGWAALLTTLGYLLGGNGVAMAGLVARYALLAICLPVLISVAPHAWRARNTLVSLVRRARTGSAAAAP